MYVGKIHVDELLCHCISLLILILVMIHCTTNNSCLLLVAIVTQKQLIIFTNIHCFMHNSNFLIKIRFFSETSMCCSASMNFWEVIRTNRNNSFSQNPDSHFWGYTLDSGLIVVVPYVAQRMTFPCQFSRCNWATPSSSWHAEWVAATATTHHHAQQHAIQSYIIHYILAPWIQIHDGWWDRWS